MESLRRYVVVLRGVRAQAEQSFGVICFSTAFAIVGFFLTGVAIGFLKQKGLWF